MTQYNMLNVKLSNSQLNKLKSGIKNGTEATLNLSSNLIENSNDETNFPHKLLSTNAEVSKIFTAFANGSSAIIKFSKTQLSKIVQLGGFLIGPPNIFGPPIIPEITSLVNPIINSVVKELKNTGTKKLNKDILVDAGLNIIGKKIKKGISLITGAGITLTNNKIKDIRKVIKSLKNRGILLRETTTKITSQEGGFLNFLRPLVTAGLPLKKIVLTPLAKSLLIPLDLSAGMSAADEHVQKNVYGSGRPSDLASRTTALIISYEEMKNIMEIVKSLEESELLINGISETIKNERKE